VRTGFSLIDQLRAAAPGLTVAAVDARITGSIANHTPGGQGHVDGTGDLLARGPWEAQDLTTAIAEVRPDALLVDSNTYGAGVAAEASGLPWAQYMASVLPLPGRGIPPYGLGLAPKGGPLGRVRDAVGWTGR